MSSATDMSTPVTRGELRDELQQLRKELATKTELEMWGGALLARIESGEQRLLARIESGEQRLLVELARHARAIQETVSTQISVIDEKYADLPERVSRLETAAPAPRQR